MTTVAKKTRKDKPRTCRLSCYVPGGEGLLRMLIGEGAKTEVFIYYLSEVGGVQTGGRAFAFVKAFSQRKPGQPHEYHVHINPDGNHSCDCLGHLRWGHKTVCKHVACARKLIEAGQLPAIPVCTTAPALKPDQFSSRDVPAPGTSQGQRKPACNGTGEPPTIYSTDDHCPMCGGSGEAVRS